MKLPRVNLSLRGLVWILIALFVIAEVAVFIMVGHAIYKKLTMVTGALTGVDSIILIEDGVDQTEEGMKSSDTAASRER